MEEELYSELRSIEHVHWWLVARRRIFIHFLRKAAARFQDSPLLLDCGFGTGAMMSDVSEFATPVGADMSRRAAIDCANLGHRYVVQAMAELLPFQRSSFEIVCAFDVLEHLDDDLAALAQWHELLKPGGLLFVSVPAYQWLWDAQDELANHRRRYTLTTLREKLSLAKFNITKATYFNTTLFPMVFLVRIVKKIELLLAPQRVNRSDFSLTGPGHINNLLMRIFAREIAYLDRGSFPFGGSIFCVARRPDA